MKLAVGVMSVGLALAQIHERSMRRSGGLMPSLRPTVDVVPTQNPRE